MRAFALLLICLPVLAIEADGTGVKLTDEDRETLKNCAAEGGCKVWSKAEIVAMLLIYHRQLMNSGAGCRRDFL